jgi:signal transduction histidine kinase
MTSVRSSHVRARANLPIRARLLFAFLIVGVLPMLVSAWLATRVVSIAFEQTVQRFLREISSFFMEDIQEESRNDTTATLQFITGDPALVDDLIAHKVLPERYTTFLSEVGYDFIVLLDRNDRIVYSYPQVQKLDQLSLLGDRALYRVTIDGKATIATTGTRRLDGPQGPYFLLLGSNLDTNFIENLDRITSIDIRLYSREAGGFHEFYSSLGPPKKARPISPEVIDQVLNGKRDVYDPNAENKQYRALYTALRDRSGTPVGILFCGLHSTSGFSILDRNNLFLFLLLSGTVLSFLTATVLARRMAEPLRALDRGVSAVAAGDYRHRVPVSGADEIGKLGQAFNSMAQRLERLQQLERQVRRRERLSALGEVALGIAHEVRNPLSIIRNSAEIVRRDLQATDFDTKLIGYVVEETDRINKLIEDFLSFAKPVPPRLALLRPIEVAERVSDFARQLLDEHAITVTLDDQAPGVTVAADRDQLFQAVLNLVLNAIEAMPQGGTLTVVQRRSGAELVLAFDDTGPGVPADMVERVFNPFFTTKPKGTGLGLAKVYGVMESLGGGVECRNHPDGGAQFLLRFPLRVEDLRDDDRDRAAGR